MEAFLPLDLQSGIGWSVFWASMPLVSASLAWTAGSMLAARFGFAPRVADRRSAPRSWRSEAWAPRCRSGVAGRSRSGTRSPASAWASRARRLFVAVLGDEPGAEGRETAAPPVARNVGASIGIAVGGALLLHLSSSATLQAAENGAAPLADLHHAARGAYLVLGLGSLAVAAGGRLAQEPPCRLRIEIRRTVAGHREAGHRGSASPAPAEIARRRRSPSCVSSGDDAL